MPNLSAVLFQLNLFSLKVLMVFVTCEWVFLAGPNDLKSNNLDFGTGTVYGSDELATLLGDNWLQQDCAMPATSVCSQVIERCTVNSVIFLFFLLNFSLRYKLMFSNSHYFCQK